MTAVSASSKTICSLPGFSTLRRDRMMSESTVSTATISITITR
jgi:hypothetical protein